MLISGAFCVARAAEWTASNSSTRKLPNNWGIFRNNYINKGLLLLILENINCHNSFLNQDGSFFFKSSFIIHINYSYKMIFNNREMVDTSYVQNQKKCIRNSVPLAFNNQIRWIFLFLNQVSIGFRVISLKNQTWPQNFARKTKTFSHTVHAIRT